MCSRVRTFTSPLSFSARETVAIETPARAATSLIVSRSRTTRTIWPGQLRPPGRESFRGENDQRRRRDFWENKPKWRQRWVEPEYRDASERTCSTHRRRSHCAGRHHPRGEYGRDDRDARDCRYGVPTTPRRGRMGYT